MADAVAVELSARGFNVVGTATTSNLLVRLNLSEVEVSMPRGFGALKSQGVDALLSVKAAAGDDQQPQSITARLNSTSTGQLISGVTWQNGFGGMSGSIADRMMRKGVNEAAEEIADAIAKRIKQ